MLSLYAIYSFVLLADSSPAEGLTWTAVAISTGLLIERIWTRHSESKERIIKLKIEERKEEAKQKVNSTLIDLQNKQTACAEADAKHKQEMVLIKTALDECKEKHKLSEERERESNKRVDELFKLVAVNKAAITQVENDNKG